MKINSCNCYVQIIENKSEHFTTPAITSTFSCAFGRGALILFSHFTHYFINCNTFGHLDLAASLSDMNTFVEIQLNPTVNNAFLKPGCRDMK